MMVKSDTWITSCASALKLAAGILLTGLIAHALYRKYIARYFRALEKPETVSFQINPAMKNMKIIVKGMTCNHCVSTVENNISSLEGIENANADLITESVTLSGENIDLDRIREKVESLGYKFGGLAE